MFEQHNETIWLTWKDEQEHTFKVGELQRKEGKYYFKYDIDGVAEAEKYGFNIIPNFPRVDAEYFREELFRAFSERISTKSKRDAENLLKKHGIEKYDKFQLLKLTGGRTENDTLEFIEPTEV